ncbi:uncharacterized protein [Antedon mediterranea]|uniref:uncharacterized protein n=1 Tax=Antedon mediterranea TaxID=105859 RepID=UPI003AF5AD25
MTEGINVQEVMMDFDKGEWQSITSVFPEVRCFGLVFHWKQAVWRHIQEIGLQRAYGERDAVFKNISKLLSLPYLPAEVIPEMFYHLQTKITQTKITASAMLSEMNFR